MRVTWGTALLVGSLLLVSSVGCQQRQLVKEKPVGDPLFTSKKPVEGRPRFAAGTPLQTEEVPLPPPPPADVPRIPIDPSRLASRH